MPSVDMEETRSRGNPLPLRPESNLQAMYRNNDRINARSKPAHGRTTLKTPPPLAEDYITRKELTYFKSRYKVPTNPDVDIALPPRSLERRVEQIS